MTYDWQRWVFKKARENGWTGREPSVLGSAESESAFEQAKRFLIDLGVSYGQANMWFSGMCKHCGVWSFQWEEYSTREVKCPNCGEREYTTKLTLNEEKKKRISTNSGFQNKNKNLDNDTRKL